MLQIVDKLDFRFIHLLLGPLCRQLSVDLDTSRLLHHDLCISGEDTCWISSILGLMLRIIHLCFSVLGKFQASFFKQFLYFSARQTNTYMLRMIVIPLKLSEVHSIAPSCYCQTFHVPFTLDENNLKELSVLGNSQPCRDRGMYKGN